MVNVCSISIRGVYREACKEAVAFWVSASGLNITIHSFTHFIKIPLLITLLTPVMPTKLSVLKYLTIKLAVNSSSELETYRFPEAFWKFWIYVCGLAIKNINHLRLLNSWRRVDKSKSNNNNTLLIQIVDKNLANM